MEVNGKHIKLNESELENGACPINPRWAGSQIERLGIPIAEGSPKLAPFTRCPGVLKAAGYTVEIIPDTSAVESSKG